MCRKMQVSSWLILAISIFLPQLENLNAQEIDRTHRFEHSTSWKKPSSENHQWSYDGACRNCLSEIEVRHGVDWKVTDVEFEDKGRSTNTSTDWRGRRTWRCTHTVVARYNIVHRGHELAENTTDEFITRSVVVTYKMKNPNYAEKSEPAPAAPEWKTPKGDAPELTPSFFSDAPKPVREREAKLDGFRFDPEMPSRRTNELRGRGIVSKPLEFSAQGEGKETVDLFRKVSAIPAIESFFFPLPESICDPDERTRVSTPANAPWNANCQLLINLGGGRSARGTGWLCGPRTVVTAGHCVHQGAGGNFFESIEVIPGMDGVSSRPFGSKVVSRTGLRASTEWKQNGSIARDFGAIILDSEFSNSAGARPTNLQVAVLGDDELRNATLKISGYPGDKPVGTQWTDTDPVASVSAERLGYYLDTIGGQSGSAVTRSDRGDVVGIHNYGGCPNNCTRITDSVKSTIDAWVAESTQ